MSPMGEDGIIEKIDAPRYKEEYLDMTEDDEHEPSEGYTGMHITQQPVALP